MQFILILFAIYSSTYFKYYISLQSTTYIALHTEFTLIFWLAKYFESI
jgi:hypothetical protein